MSETPLYNIGPSGKCYFHILIFIMSCFVFKHVYDLKGGKKAEQQSQSLHLLCCYSLAS